LAGSEAATWELVRSWDLTDRGKLLVFFYAAKRAGVVVPERLVDSMIFLLRKAGLPFNYLFQYRTLPQSPELHNDLFILEQRGEIRHESPFSISALGAKWVENDVSSCDGFPTVIDHLTERVAAYRDWDEEQFFAAFYASL